MTHRVHESDTKKCPQCKQQIKSWESRCSKCGYEFEEEQKEEEFVVSHAYMGHGK